jgi:hypothetical protein
MSRVQVAVVQIIRMITMLDSFMTTLLAVTVKTGSRGFGCILLF